MIDPSSRTAPRRDIQGLRALAVVGVVLAHLVGWPTGGFAGVDVFFVVSGFLITSLLLREIAATGRLSLRDFFARRVRRILPAALLVLVVVTGAGFFVFNTVRAEQTVADAVAALFVAANWRFAALGTDYFHAADAVSPLQHYWTLSVEEQFYLVWPVLLLVLLLFVPLAARRGAAGRAVVGVAALVVTGASIAIAVVQTGAEPTVAYFSALTRAWELGAGALLAVAAPVLGRLPAALRWLFGWAGLATVVWAFLVIDPDTMPFPAPWAALPVAGAALVIAGGVGGDPRQRHLFPLTNPVGVFVGDVSYSLYLWHFPVIVIAAVLLPDTGESLPVVVAAIVVLSLASYFGLEQPLHRSPWLRRRAAPEPAAEAPAAAVLEAETEPAAPVAADPQTAPEPSRIVSTRPAGWSPGQRYYPGSRPRPEAPAPALALAVSTPAPQHPASARPALDRRAALEPAAPAERPPVLTPASSWAAWRARFAGQFGFSAAGLGIGAGVVVLLVLLTYGAPAGVFVPGAPVVAAADDGIEEGADLQAALEAAVSATEWPQLRPSLDQVMARSSADNPAHDCFSPDVVPDAGRCTWGSADAARHMYLVGDSSAMAYAPAFKAIAEQSGGAWRVTTVGLYGCRFTDVLVENSGAGVMAACPQRKDQVREMIAAGPADLVVVSNAYTLGRTASGANLDASALLSATRDEMASYGATGRTVYLAPPPHGGSLDSCYSPVSSPANCLTAVDRTWHDMAAAAEATAAATGDHALESLHFSCWQEVCPAFAGELPLRYDETHLTVAYAEHIAPILRADLAAMGLL